MYLTTSLYSNKTSTSTSLVYHCYQDTQDTHPHSSSLAALILVVVTLCVYRVLLDLLISM